MQQQKPNPDTRQLHRLWVKGYRADTLKTVQKKHYDLIFEKLPPQLQEGITPKYRPGQAGFPIDCPNENHCKMVWDQLKDFSMTWNDPVAKEERKIYITLDSSLSMRLLRRLLGVAWSNIEAHMKKTGQWTDTRAMGCNFYSGKLWFSDGEGVFNLLKAKLNDQFEPELVFNNILLEKINYDADSINELKAKIAEAMSRKQ